MPHTQSSMGTQPVNYFSSFYHLLDVVSLEGDIFGGAMPYCGHNIYHSLYFMNDSVSVWQLLPILHLDLTASYNSAQLLLDLLCERKDAQKNLMIIEMMLMMVEGWSNTAVQCDRGLQELEWLIPLCVFQSSWHVQEDMLSDG